MVLFQEDSNPSAFTDPGWRWGISVSMSIRNPTPKTNPPAAGNHPGIPDCSASSMAGIKRLHTEAATITPAAKPKNTRWIFLFISPRKKNTKAAPSIVIKKVNPVPVEAHSKDFPNSVSPHFSIRSEIPEKPAAPSACVCRSGCPLSPILLNIFLSLVPQKFTITNQI